MRNRIFASRLRYAQLVFPQTLTSETRLRRFYGSRIPRTCVVPAAYSKPRGSAESAPEFPRRAECKYLLSLTRYYRHKNLEILIPVARRLKEAGSPIRIITTVEMDQGDGAPEFLESIRREQLSDWVINIGRVPFKSVPDLYQKVDGLLLPTLLESYSSTYPDSMYFRKPVFTSDLDFARDVCGDAALYFDPLDPESIFRILADTLKDEARLKEKVAIGFQRVQSLPDWMGVTRMYVSELEELVACARIAT